MTRAIWTSRRINRKYCLILADNMNLHLLWKSPYESEKLMDIVRAEWFLKGDPISNLTARQEAILTDIEKAAQRFCEESGIELL